MILQITTDFTGQVGVKPRVIRILCNDSYETVVANNFLLPAKNMGETFDDGDFAAVTYGTTPTSQMFIVSIADGVIRLIPDAGEVVLPVVDNDFTVFDGTTGALKDAGYSPSDATKTKVVMASSGVTTGIVPQFNDTAGTIGNSTVYANKVLAASFASPDVNSNIVSFDVTLSAGALAGAELVPLYGTASDGRAYKIRSLFVNSGGTNFSGGSGNRSLQITDGATVYSVISNINLGTLPGNVAWGNAALGFPAGAPINTSSIGGIYATYSGGTNDYTTGSITISGVLERVL